MRSTFEKQRVAVLSQRDWRGMRSKLNLMKDLDTDLNGTGQSLKDLSEVPSSLLRVSLDEYIIKCIEGRRGEGGQNAEKQAKDVIKWMADALETNGTLLTLSMVGHSWEQAAERCQKLLEENLMRAMDQ